MVKITMNQVMDFRNNIGFFSSVNLPLKGAYKLNKIRKSLEKESDFYNEKFQEIVEKYSRKDENGEIVFNEDGSQIMIQEDLIDECDKALTDLQNLEVEVDNCNLTIEDLGEDFECTPDQLGALMPFME